MFKHLQCEAHWTTPAADIHHGSCHTKTLLTQPLRQQKLHPNPRESSSIFNATPTGPSPSMVHLLPCPAPRLARRGWPGENRSPTVTKLPPGPWPGKGPSVASGFPTYIKIKLKIDLLVINCHSYPPRPPNTHYVRKQQRSLACRLVFVIYIYISLSLSLFCLRCTKGSLEWAGKASVNIHHRPPHSFTVLAPLEKGFGAWSLEMLLPSSIGREVVGPKKS